MSQTNPSGSFSLDQQAEENALYRLMEHSLDCQVSWFSHQCDNCVTTDWRILPFSVVLHIRSGEYRCEFDYEEVSAGPGEVLLVPAGIRHRLHVDVATVADGLHIHFTLFHSLDVLTFYRVPAVIEHRDAGDMRRTIDELTGVLQGSENYHNLNNLVLKRSASLRLLFDMLSVSKPVDDKQQRLLQVNRVLPALRLVDAQLGEALNVETLAAACNLSRNAFSRLFKQATGTSPLRYINQKRLQQAMAQLVYSDQSIAVIAKAVGFCDQFHFSKRFRTEVGQSPSEYRASIRKTLPQAI